MSSFIIKDERIERYIGNDSHVTVPAAKRMMHWVFCDKRDIIVSVEFDEGVEIIEAKCLDHDSLCHYKHYNDHYGYPHGEKEPLAVCKSCNVLGLSAFDLCDKLETITFPASLREANLEFNGCNSLREINVAENNPYFSSNNGILFNKNQTALLRFPLASKIKEYCAPKGIIETSEEAFHNCNSLESVVFEEGLVSLGSFHGCERLKQITLPLGLKEIISFRNCKSLAKIELPEGLIKIRDNDAFANCKLLEEIRIPSTIENFQDHIFVGSGLKRIYLPLNIKDKVSLRWCEHAGVEINFY